MAAPDAVPQFGPEHRLALPVRPRHHDAFIIDESAECTVDLAATGEPPTSTSSTRVSTPEPSADRTSALSVLSPRRQREAKAGGRELPAHLPAAAPRGENLALTDHFFCARPGVQHVRQTSGSDARPCERTAPRGATNPPLPRPGGAGDRGDRSSAGTRTSNHQGISLRSDRRQGARGQGTPPGSVPRLRGALRAPERQGRRLRVLQLRREALCCIPGAAGRNSEGCSWVQ